MLTRKQKWRIFKNLIFITCEVILHPNCQICINYFDVYIKKIENLKLYTYFIYLCQT